MRSQRWGDGTFPLPVSLLPLVGGLAGLFFAVLLGFVTTKKSGTTFAMITLGIGELATDVGDGSRVLRRRAGVSANRHRRQGGDGRQLRPQIQVYYLLAIYTIICTALMYAFTRTPLGRILNAGARQPGAGRVSSATARSAFATTRSSSPASSPGWRAACMH